MKYLLLGFDYELYLGRRSGTVKKCLIEPTERIRELLSNYQVKGIFFIDTTYLIQLRKLAHFHPNAAADFACIKNQIQQLACEGHSVFPHIHPHWLDARYLVEENQWDLSNTGKYRFHHLTVNEREYVFGASVELLHEMLSPLSIPYKLDGFRAGGWCIQPFSDFKPYFEKYGIRYDFSVLKDEKCISSSRYFDFSRGPAQSCYAFSKDVLVPAAGPFAEYAISRISFSALQHFKSRLLLRLLPEQEKARYGDGFSMLVRSGKKSLLQRLVSEKLTEMVSIELLNAVKLKEYNRFLEKQHYMQFISHPKMISPHNLRMFDSFLHKAAAKYTIESDFRKIRILKLYPLPSRVMLSGL